MKEGDVANTGPTIFYNRIGIEFGHVIIGISISTQRYLKNTVSVIKSNKTWLCLFLYNPLNNEHVTYKVN